MKRSTAYRRGAADDPRWTSDIEPAPGDLRIVQAFAATAGPGAEGALASPRALSDWLARWGLLRSGTELGKADFERAVEVRAVLRDLLRANSGEGSVEKAASRLDRAASEVRFRLRFEAGVTRFEPAADGFEGALARLFDIVGQARLGGSWVRLKICDRDGCRRPFYDFSKNRSARWCTSRCGNRLSARTYRKRTRRYY